MGGTRSGLDVRTPSPPLALIPQPAAPQREVRDLGPAGAWAVRTAPPREVPSLEPGPAGAGRPGHPGLACLQPSPSCTGAPAAHPEGEAGTVTIWWGAGGVAVGVGALR